MERGREGNREEDEEEIIRSGRCEVERRKKKRRWSYLRGSAWRPKRRREVGEVWKEGKEGSKNRKE